MYGYQIPGSIGRQEKAGRAFFDVIIDKDSIYIWRADFYYRDKFDNLKKSEGVEISVDRKFFEK